jgi:hypothetical protein
MKFSLKDLFYAFTYVSLGILCLVIYSQLLKWGSGRETYLLLLSGIFLGRALGGLSGKPELTYLGGFVGFLAFMFPPSVRY